MKLINIEDEPLLKTVSAGGLSAKALWRLIKSQRTIKAIPIEWIKEKLEKEEYRTFLVDYIEWGNCLRWLLEKWEKENADNKTK